MTDGSWWLYSTDKALWEPRFTIKLKTLSIEGEWQDLHLQGRILPPDSQSGAFTNSATLTIYF